MAEKMSKPNLVYAHICDDVRFETGDKVSLMGLFDRIFAPNFPAMHPRFVVIAAWSGAAGEFSSEILLEGPDGRVQSLGSAKFELPNEKRTHHHIAVNLNWRIDSPGIHQVRIKLDSTLVKSLPLTVEHSGTVH